MADDVSRAFSHAGVGWVTGMARAATRRRVVFTIVSANYIGFAATLMQSVAAHVPFAERYIILADTAHDFPDIDLSAKLIICDRLDIPNIDNMKLWYSVIEFNTAIKPYAFLHFFNNEGFDEACYIDPDIYLFSEMREVFFALVDHSCVLTPHMTDPLQDGKEPSDLTIMKSGVYNLGFLALRNDEDGRRLAEWWADRCFMHCRVDIAENMFTDQRWMDLAPVFVRHPFILRHPGYNVAYWNLLHRTVDKSESGQWFVNGETLVFFHFSGINPMEPKNFSKHQDRFYCGNLGVVNELCERYCERVLANNWLQYSKKSYGFGSFRDGRRIDDHMRRWIVRMVDEGRLNAQDRLIFASDFFDRPDEIVAERGVHLTRFMYQFWLDRKDLRAAFDIFTAGGLRSYCDWFLGGDAAASGVDEPCLRAAVALLDTRPARPPAAPLPRVTPPWPPVAADVWAGPSKDVLRHLSSDIVIEVGRWRMRLPKQMALVWERRPDLQSAFDVNVPERLQDFANWAITNGITDGCVDPSLFSADFIADFQKISRISELYSDVPVSEGMILTRKIDVAREYTPGWRRFPVERAGRLAQGLWLAFIAPKRFRWPDAMVAPVRNYFYELTKITVDGFRLNRACMSLWELRPDIQRTFPLSDGGSVRRFLQWLLIDGLRELGVGIDLFDPRLRTFLLSDSPRFMGVTQLIELLYDHREDLRRSFDLSIAEGREKIRSWADSDLRKETADIPLGEVLMTAATEDGALEVELEHHASVALSGYWFAPSGRGEDLRASARALDAVGFFDYVIVDFETRSAFLPDGSSLEGAPAIVIDVNVVHANADTAADDNVTLRGMKVRADRTIGFWAWELEWLPDEWRHAYSFYDEIWAATTFAETAFTRGSLRPVTRVPMAVIEPSAEFVLRRSDLGLPEKATVFLFMFDFRSFAMRKNPEAVIKAFMAAFPLGDEPVYLLIKTSGAAARPADWHRLRDIAADPRIELRDVQLQREEVLNLIRLADAFVSLHRSEGFGRGPAEAMLLGVPVILTDYSGSADYATPACALVVDYDLVPVREADYPGVSGQCWAEANVATAAHQMRWVAENPDDAHTLGEKGRDQIRRLYNLRAIGEGILRALGIAADIAPRAVVQVD